MKLKTMAYKGLLPSWSLLVTLYSLFFEGASEPATGSDPKANFAAISTAQDGNRPTPLRKQRKLKFKQDKDDFL